jgi:hypothetical protein
VMPRTHNTFRGYGQLQTGNVHKMSSTRSRKPTEEAATYYDRAGSRKRWCRHSCMACTSLA